MSTEPEIDGARTFLYLARRCHREDVAVVMNENVRIRMEYTTRRFGPCADAVKTEYEVVYIHTKLDAAGNALSCHIEDAGDDDRTVQYDGFRNLRLVHRNATKGDSQ